MEAGSSAVLGGAGLRVVQCHADPAVGRERRRVAAAGGRRPRTRRSSARSSRTGVRAYADFDRLSLSAPSLDVDTTQGYVPGVEAIAAFVNQR